MTYQSADAIIAAMKASADETNRRMRYLDAADMAVANEVGGHSVPTGVLAAIVAEAAEAFGVSEMEIIGQSRRIPIATARKAVYFAAMRHGYTTTAIGRALSRDHSTVSKGAQRYAEMRAAS